MFFCSNAYIFSKKRFEKDVFVVGGIISWLCNSYVDNSSDGETTVYGTRGRRKIVFLKDMLLFGGGILILIIASNMKKDS